MIESRDLRGSKHDFMEVFCGGLLFWTSLYFVVNSAISIKSVPKKNEHDIINRVISTCHGFSCLFLTGVNIFVHGAELDAINSNFQQFVFINSSAYFFYDTVAILWNKIADAGTLAHHAMVCIAFIVAMHSHYGGTECMWALFFAEVSNFPMNARFVLRSLDLKHTKICDLSELSFVVLFVLARGVFVPFAVVHCVSSQNCPILLKMMSVGLFLQSILYIIEMFKIALRKKKQEKERKKEGVELYWFSVNPKLT